MLNKNLHPIIDLISDKLPSTQRTVIRPFAIEFSRYAISNDFAGRHASDLAGSVLSCWRLLYQRTPLQCKIQVFNPTRERDGWECPNTVIIIAQDNMPFLVDSLQMVLNRMRQDIYTIVHLGGIKFARNAKNCITKVGAITGNNELKGSSTEAPIYIEIAKQTDANILCNIQAEIEKILSDVQAAYCDWPAMKNKMQAAKEELALAQAAMHIDKGLAELWQETSKFLDWLLKDNFVFLGYRCYSVVKTGHEQTLNFVANSSLGFLRNKKVTQVYKYLQDLNPKAQQAVMNDEPLLLVKTNTISTVHKPVYTDSIIIKRYDKHGKVIGAHRFIGLYAHSVYHNNVKLIPYLNYKVEKILQKFDLPRDGYSSKTLWHILESFPRDDLILTDINKLYEVATSIFDIQERRLTKLFVLEDIYHRYVSCLVYLPRDNFNTDVRYRIQEILRQAFHGTDVTFDVIFSESVLARVHYVIRLGGTQPLSYDVCAIEQEIIKASVSWYDELQEALFKAYGRKDGEKLLAKYINTFPAGYRETFSAAFALADIEKMEQLQEMDGSSAGTSIANNLNMVFYHLPNTPENVIQLKLFFANQTIPLSDTLPLLENFGFRVISEQAYQISFNSGDRIYISDFNLVLATGNAAGLVPVTSVYEILQEAFIATWQHLAENDGFNRLLTLCGLTWRQVTIFRAYAKYLRQAKFTYSQQYIENTLARYPVIAKLLCDFFISRFMPASKAKKPKAGDKDSVWQQKFASELEKVATLDEERILTRLLALMEATVRTNYFQNKNYLSYKLASSAIPDLPLPCPLYEIFVYATAFEGVHLRMAKVARGGLRWSDRREDFRTEILGLVKAQQVKNVVIIPYGAKGGFVVKKSFSARELMYQEAINCYQNFLRGLLDVTDNIVKGKIVPPAQVICHDESDPYLVVAADKGTAAFSDIANSISKEYNFWLQDAFASGGSSGYDHKKLGITAKGSWEAVKYHFTVLGLNPETDEFTVVGIGDMSGDVFGNGMLLSKHIKLIGAFDHRHIFLDPNPDTQRSFMERQRLFKLPQSSWDDYDRKVLSSGGGIYERGAKSIQLKEEAKKLLGFSESVVTPQQVLQALLRAPVTLLWNGGIGTFVKASSEDNSHIGDHSNDAVRVNADTLRCKVVAEGGNLGLTQLARIEYALHGGAINTDFIDNSGGVDCSDHEVNIKILLNEAVANKLLTKKKRDQILQSMTSEVVELVLRNNYRQMRALDLLRQQSLDNLPGLKHFIDKYEKEGKLNRNLEFLPNDRTLIERQSQHLGLTRPEVAVLLAYGKLILKGKLIESSLHTDPFFAAYLSHEFPSTLVQKFGEALGKHRLRREIISTQLSNDFITDLGIGFLEQVQEASKMPIENIVRAYVVAKTVLGGDEIIADIARLDNVVDIELQRHLSKLWHDTLASSCVWFAHFLPAEKRSNTWLMEVIKTFQENLHKLKINITALLNFDDGKAVVAQYQDMIAHKIPPKLALLSVMPEFCLAMFDITGLVWKHKFEIMKTARIYLAVEKQFGFKSLQQSLQRSASPDNYWASVALYHLQSKLSKLQREICLAVLKKADKHKTAPSVWQQWLQQHQKFDEQWQAMIHSVKTGIDGHFALMYLALRELGAVVNRYHLNIGSDDKEESFASGE